MRNEEAEKVRTVATEAAPPGDAAAALVRSRAAVAPALERCLEVLSGPAGGGDDGREVVRRALELIADPLVLVGPDRRIVFANAASRELTGEAPEALLGRRCIDGLGLRTCGLRCTLYADGRVCGRECELVDSEGARRRVLKNARVLRDAGGRVVGGLEKLNDVTELLSDGGTERAITVALSERTDAPLIAVDATGEVTWASERAGELLRVAPRALVGRRAEAWCRTPGPLVAALERVFEGASDEETAQVARDVAATVRPIRVEGRVAGALLELHAAEALPAGEVAPGLIGASAAMKSLGRVIHRLAAADFTVLITGETGSGKEAVARAIHAAGPRRQKPFHAISCAALTETLLESELFGHERGAYTDAVSTRRGRLEQSADGTLLLDEIGCLSLPMQAKLLRVLDRREFERVGGNKTLRLEARILAATNANLEAEVRAGRFRADLYYRLQTIPLEVPPLRKRREDVLPLARHFLAAARPDGARLGPATEQALTAYGWPGNVRELRNALQFAASFAPSLILQPCDLPPALRRNGALLTSCIDAEEAQLRQALEGAKYHRGRAAEALGISRATLWRKMRQHGLA